MLGISCELFLINRLFYQYAVEIFISNAVYVYDDRNRASYRNPNLTLNLFSAYQLKLVWKIVFYFQDLKIKRPKSYNVWPVFQPMYEEAIQFIHDHMNLERLTIWIVDSGKEHSRSFAPEETKVILFTKDVRAEMKEREWEILQEITKHLLKLRGLEGFLVRFGCNPCYPRDNLQREREAILERRVMGDNYRNPVNPKKYGIWSSYYKE